MKAMVTQILKIDGSERDNEIILQAAEIIRRGGLVAFPTETVYGLGANALNREAVEKVYVAKQRPGWDPLISHVDSFAMLHKYLRRQHPLLKELLSFMPGPLTILLDQNDVFSDLVTTSAGKISLRMPLHPIARKLIAATGFPIAAPSANLFGRPSPTMAKHVLEDLDGKIEAIIDDGSTNIGIESTVLDLTATPPMILRPGGISKEQLEEVLGPIDLFERNDKPQGGDLESPGIILQHYSPQASVVLSEGTEMALKSLSEELQGKKVGVLLPKGWDIGGLITAFSWGDWNNKEELAHNLFQGFRELDQQGIEIIICPKPEPFGLGLAILDRLTRAAA